MDAIILKCPRNGRFHFGIAAPDNDTALSQTSDCFHSDMLFSALINIAAKIFDDSKVDNFVNAFRAGNIQISSGSYCLDIYRTYENERNFKRIYFLPKPVHLDVLNPNNTERKKVKRVQYISKAIWEKGIVPKDWTKRKCYNVDGKFQLMSEEINESLGNFINGFFKKPTEPKIADHNRKRVNNIFAQTDIHLQTTEIKEKQLVQFENLKNYRVEPHFYFLLNYSEEGKQFQPMMDLILNVLPDEGLGGAISTGCGQILGIEKEENWTLNFDKTEAATNQMVSLSLVAPNTSENANLLAGEMIIRGGRNTSDFGTLKRIKMVKAGAVIQNSLKGKMPNILNSNAKEVKAKVEKGEKIIPFLRYGKAFPLAISKNYEYHV